MAHAQQTDLPVISSLADFNRRSGSFLERLVFNNRVIVVVLCLLATVALGYQASKIELQAGFEKMLPTEHPFVVNYLDNKAELSGLGNNLLLVVESNGASIYEPEFLAAFEAINDEVFYISGVDRVGMKSIFTSNMRWRIVTEEGFEGGQVLPNGFDHSQEKIAELRRNVARSGIVGQLVANDERSAAILIPLLDADPDTGEPLDLHAVSSRLEELRDKYQQAGYTVRITGFAKIVGSLIDGMVAVMAFFLLAMLIATLLLYWYTRDARSTFVVIVCTVIAVIWQLGILATIGFELDPYSVLVPFLVFAIGVSHGAQKLNGVIQSVAAGTHPYIAARYTFRQLFLAGVTALLSDGVGFAVLLIIAIPVIRDLAVTASIGVSVLIFTNLILIPVVLSYLGVSQKAALRAADPIERHEDAHLLWRFLLKFTERKWATGAVLASAGLAAFGLYVARDLQIGDLDPGAPELRPDSQYNRDVAYMNDHYGTSSDVFAVIVKSDVDGCIDYEALSLANELEWRLRELESVEDIRGLNVKMRQFLAGINEGYIKFYSLYRNQDSINFAVTSLIPDGYANAACSLWPMLVFLSDHMAATLGRVVDTLAEFNAEFPADKVEFLGAAGSAGFEAATNIVVKKANREMMFYVYGAVILLCLVTFRSLTGVICAVVPLILTTILCEALMVWLGIGVKVATLPVIALGVGIGVDYALYVLTVILAKERQGIPLHRAYFETLMFTGKVVALIGVTLAAGVVTWTLSPIKFQADMGILLTFMFLWNMVGALVLMPALAHFLLRPRKTRQEQETLRPNSAPA
jgi:predicted RND superfamily exporter protein